MKLKQLATKLWDKLVAILTFKFYFKGTVSDIQTYDRTLSQEEVTLLYESYKSKLQKGEKS